MATTLEPLILASLQSTWVGAAENLKARFIAGEDIILEYSRNLVVSPDADVKSQQTLIAHKRAEVYAAIIAEFHQNLLPAMASNTSEAIVGYLRLHSVSTVLPGVCVTSYGPTPVANTTASVVYT